MILNIKQSEALDILEDNIHHELVFGGGAGGSKSFLGCYWLLKMCLKYPGTRWLMGRSRLKSLKETTLNSFFEVAKLQSIEAGSHYTYNAQSNTIKLFNGSEILLKDLFHYPADPQYDSLGSLEITGAFVDEVNQVSELAWNIVKSRIRYKLDEYGLIPKILGTCNPSKNWVYKNFYKASKTKQIDVKRHFIQALASDNPFISKHYIDNLNGLPKPQRDRLLLGIWESDDDPSCLVSYDSILSIFTNTHVDTGDIRHYLTCDVARMGKDKAVIMVWRGMEVVELIEYSTSRITELQTVIIALKNKYNIPNNNILADEDGVGGGLVDNLKVQGFLNNSKAINGENYQNLKTQCYYKLAECINKYELYISAEISTQQQEHIIEELEQVKASDMDSDGRLKIVSKAEIKHLISRSPDYSDCLMMRMYFLLENRVTKYRIR